MSSKPDAPITSSAEDLLGRLPFVNEIVDLALTTPKEWAPRIGVYGSWGSGKTSVQNLVAERLVQARQVVARFNPWGFHDVDEMFGALADAVLDALDEQSDEIKKAARRAEKVSKALHKGAKVAGQTTKHAGDIGIPGARIASGVFATAGYVSGVLRRVFEKKKIAQLLEALDELPAQTRCIVLVDDVDRAEPTLLPPLLFALHEVLVAMPITFVMALDPTVVGAALKVHHPGFGDGLSFLEKMIQFPRWLPEITEDDLWRLTTKDIDEYVPSLDRDALRQEFDRFPRNPRELRTLLRSLWGLNSQAPRYRAGEISWNLVLRLSLLRQRHRRALEVLLDDEERLTHILALQFATGRRDSEVPIVPYAPMTEALTSHGIDPGCLPEIINALATGDLRWDGGLIIRHAHLVERPPAITRLEIEHLVAPLLEAGPSQVHDEVIRRVLGEHARAAHRSLDQVADQALSHLLDMHNEFLEQSADGVFERGTIDHARAASRIVGLVAATIRAQCTNASAEQFRRTLFAFSRWAHFDALEPYRSLHLSEHQLLLELCRDAVDPGGYLEVLEPWDRNSERTVQATLLRSELVRVLEVAVDATLDNMLERPDGVSGMLHEPRSSERWCLLRRCAWTPERILRVSTLDTDAASNNALDLLRLLANVGGNARPNLRSVDHGELDAMASDHATTAALWTVLTRRPLNMRFLISVESIRVALEKRRGEALPLPPWWERVRALRDAATQTQRQRNVDREPDDGELPRRS